jgi:hypothetical protein
MLEHFEVFRDACDGEEMKQIISKFVPIEYKHNEIILRNGDIGNFLVVLFSGKV